MYDLLTRPYIICIIIIILYYIISYIYISLKICISSIYNILYYYYIYYFSLQNKFAKNPIVKQSIWWQQMKDSWDANHIFWAEPQPWPAGSCWFLWARRLVWIESDRSVLRVTFEWTATVTGRLFLSTRWLWFCESPRSVLFFPGGKLVPDK